MSKHTYKYFLALTICFCFLISGCASQGAGSDKALATMENPLKVPLVGEEPSFYIVVKNSTTAQIDLEGITIALLQSEYDMQIADNAAIADYVINLTIDNFAQTGTEHISASTGEVALPAVGGAVAGAQIGSSIDGGEGALIGAGIGALAGISLGIMTSGGTHQIWQMTVDIDIEDQQNEKFTSRIDAKAQGEDMDAQEAAEALQNEVAWSVVRAFNKQ